MSEPVRDLIFASGLVVIAAPYLIHTWVRAERQARKELAKLTPPRDLTLEESQTEWLVVQLVRRAHWTVLATGVLDAALIGLLIFLHDMPLVTETGGILFVMAIMAGHLVGGILAAAASARAAIGSRRSASLTTRSSHTYVRTWERTVRTIDVVLAAAGVTIATALWLRGSLAGEAGRFYVGLTVAWLVLAAALTLLERWVLRAPPVVDESLHVARELLISISVRTILSCHLPFVAVLCYLGATYANLTFGLAWGWTIVPLYAAGAVALAEYVARSNREEEGGSAPEWHFARVPGSTA